MRAAAQQIGCMRGVGARGVATGSGATAKRPAEPAAKRGTAQETPPTKRPARGRPFFNLKPSAQA